jgi:hypothetical protein
VKSAKLKVLCKKKEGKGEEGHLRGGRTGLINELDQSSQDVSTERVYQ